MADPIAYIPSYSFTGYQATNPTDPLPAASLDDQLEGIATSLADAVAAIKDVRRSDGALVNEIVTLDSLHPDLLLEFVDAAALAVGRAAAVKLTGSSTTSNAIGLTSLEFEVEAGLGWIVGQRVRATYTTDLAKYVEGVITAYVDTLLTINVNRVSGSGTYALWSIGVIGEPGATGAGTGDMLEATYDPQGISNDAFDRTNHTGRAYAPSDPADPFELVTLRYLRKANPAGRIIEWPGAAVPNDWWVFCYGQLLSRTTYAELFSHLGTTWGVGDGSTTFKLPTREGLTAIGRDNMSGIPAGRVTVAGSQIDGTTLGFIGGAQSEGLELGHLPVHTHGPGSLTTSTVAAVPLYSPDSHSVDTGGDAIAFSTFGNGGASVVGTVPAHSHTVNGGVTGAVGSGSAHHNVQPSVIMNFIIFLGIPST